MGPLPRPLAPSPTPDHTRQGLARGRDETASWGLQLKATWEVDGWVGSRAVEAPPQGRHLCTTKPPSLWQQHQPPDLILDHHCACCPGPLCSASIHPRAARPCWGEHILLNPQPLQAYRPQLPQSKLPLTCEAGGPLAHSSLLPGGRPEPDCPCHPQPASLWPHPCHALWPGIQGSLPETPVSSYFQPLLQPSERAPPPSSQQVRGPPPAGTWAPERASEPVQLHVWAGVTHGDHPPLCQDALHNPPPPNPQLKSFSHSCAKRNNQPTNPHLLADHLGCHFFAFSRCPHKVEHPQGSLLCLLCFTPCSRATPSTEQALLHQCLSLLK